MQQQEAKTLRNYFERDEFAKLAGIALLDFGEGWARTRMTIEKKHHNALNIAQGGALFTLADYAFAVASNSYGTVALGVEVNIAFFRGVGEGTVFADAAEVWRHKKLAHYTVLITDEQGNKLAKFDGTVFRKEKPLDL